jgi:hypothetical protein
VCNTHCGSSVSNYIPTFTVLSCVKKSLYEKEMPLNGFRWEYEKSSVVERDEMVVEQFPNVENKTNDLW